jgi:copper(I)-binding protein
MIRVTFTLAAMLAVSASPTTATDYNLGPLQIVQPWARATPKGASVAGGFMKITNKGTAPDRLLGGTAGFAGRFEIHEMKMEQGVMKMRPLSAGLEIKPGQTVELKPGSFHVMFMELKAPLEKGQRVKGTLEFEKAGKIEVEYTVEAIGASSAGQGAPAAPGHGQGMKH